MQSHCRTLAGDEVAEAHSAIWALKAAPRQTVPFFREHLCPATTKATKRLPPLVADLDCDEFAVRDAATRALEELGEIAKPALNLLDGKPSLEKRCRDEDLLAKLRRPLLPGERLRNLRAVEVLEHIGTLPAQRVLQAIAQAAAGARLTREAQAALHGFRSRELSDR